MTKVLMTSLIHKSGVWLTLCLVCLVGSHPEVQANELHWPVISEFMADNDATFSDGEGQYPDWIEIYNPHGQTMDLSGFFLTDDTEELAKWSFPDGTSLAPGQFLVVFASGQPQENSRDKAGFLHTTFRLSNAGEYLGLIAPDGHTVVHAFSPAYPEQRADISYAKEGYFTNPTPGQANDESPVPGIVTDTRFYPARGIYPNPMHPHMPLKIHITTATEAADIFYTLDGSEPSPNHGLLYTEPIRVTTTTVVRAAAFKGVLVPTEVDTHTYLFPNHVIFQGNAPAGYPLEWAGHPADYEMDPEVVTDPRYADHMESSLRVFPSLSISCASQALFGATGLYQNPQQQGQTWERPVSVELIASDGSESGFQVDAGLRIQGGSSRNPDTPKHSFSLRFRKEYGSGRLDYPLFVGSPSGDTAVESFDFLQLRSGYNFGWTHRHYYQCRHAQYNRDQWTNDLLLAMGQPASHGRWVHLYLNGLYWGIYHLHERPDKDFMASYLGGEPDEYDVLNSGSPTSGNKNAWNAMMAIAQGNMADSAEYARIQQYLDIDSLIDYIILNCYIGNLDWDGHNWRAARQRVPGAKFRFFPWDSEFAISPNGPGVKSNPASLSNALNINRTGLKGNGRPSGLHQRLTLNQAYCDRFADRIHQHLFPGGALSPNVADAIWRDRSIQMDRAIISESARWGDFRRDVEAPSWPQANFDLYTRDDHYWPDQAYILDTYLPQRTDIVLAQFRHKKLYPELDAPVYVQSEGMVPPGSALAILNPNDSGTIYYTVDGTDPRPSTQIELPVEPLMNAHILLDTNAVASAFVPADNALGQTWTASGFDDSAWLQGRTGIGYEWSTSGTYTSLINLKVSGAYRKNATVYARVTFQIVNQATLNEINALLLNMTYDDGFVAYLNGMQIASAQAPDTPVWNARATSSHANDAPLEFEPFNVSYAIGFLHVGTNVLAIHLLNESATSRGLLAVPQLVYSTQIVGQTVSNALKYTGDILLTQTGPVKARIFKDNEWSALASTFFVVGVPAYSGNLIISELFYNPPGSAEDTEFIELMNISVTDTIDLTGVRFGAGIDYACAPGTTLAPDERLLIVADPIAFETEYGTDLPVVGQFTGNLDNAGETIRLVALDGTDIEMFVYDDKSPWPENADGQGFSLVRVMPRQNQDPQFPTSWTSGLVQSH